MIRKILNEEIKKSLFIEFYYGRKIVPSYYLTENKNLLCEKHGIIPNMDYYIDAFLDFINTLNFTDKKQTTVLTDNIWKDIEGCFFKDVNIKINYCVSDKSNVKGVFTGMASELVDGKIPLLRGEFIIFTGVHQIEEHTSAIFAHELTHAYEEFKRKKNGAESLFDYARKINYDKNVDRYYSTVDAERAISNLVYFTTNFELRAYIGSIYGALKSNVDKIKASADAFEIIKNTVVYQNYIVNGMNLDYLWKTFDTSNAKIIEQAWYNATGKKGKAYDILSEIEKRYNKQWKKLKRTVAKIAYDVYEKYGEVSIIDDNNLIKKYESN